MEGGKEGWRWPRIHEEYTVQIHSREGGKEGRREGGKEGEERIRDF